MLQGQSAVLNGTFLKGHATIEVIASPSLNLGTEFFGRTFEVRYLTIVGESYSCSDFHRDIGVEEQRLEIRSRRQEHPDD